MPCGAKVRSPACGGASDLANPADDARLGEQSRPCDRKRGLPKMTQAVRKLSRAEDAHNGFLNCRLSTEVVGNICSKIGVIEMEFR
jgi:hypothetical protein